MRMQHTQNVYTQLSNLGVVPVIAIEDPKAALPLADALLEGGLPVVEITFRTAVAAQVIQTMRRERPNLLVGAGTVLTMENLEAALAAGASFALAPGLNPDIVKRSKDLGLPFIPGVATPSEIEQALSLGCSVVKLFPSELLGGVKILNAYGAPYGHTGVKFVPTGGVNLANLESYLTCKVVAAVGGTWIATKEDLATGNWQEIKRRCQAVVEIVSRLRAGK